MSYDPQAYWAARKNPAPEPLPGYAADYITRHIEGAETILDFGIGEGRLLPLYGDRAVTGCDIVFRDLPVPMIYYPYGDFDAVIASKVLLHIEPEQIEWYLYQLAQCGEKVVVYDTVGPCGAAHNFNHDFGSMVDMKDVVTRGKDLLFWYA